MADTIEKQSSTSQETRSSKLAEERDAFIGAVGERLHKVREERGLSRRELSELSFVSQRFIAQLEKGGGNVSIAVLKRITDALDYPMALLLEEPGSSGEEARQLLNTILSADEQQRARIYEILGGPAAPAKDHKRVALIGLRGAGKSTLGALAAEALSVPFVELNKRIEYQGGIGVDEVMALYGQEGYRQLEFQALRRIAEEEDGLVLEVAGGIVSEQQTFDFLIKNFHTVWLKAKPEEHMERVRQQGDERPMAGNPRAMDELRSILTNREANYARADHLVDTSGTSLENALEQLKSVLKSLSIG